MFNLRGGFITHMCGSKGRDRGSGPPPPLKNHKHLRFLNNSGPDPLKKYEATEASIQYGSSSARQRNAIKMAFRWRADGGPRIVLFGSTHPSSAKKSVVKVGPPLTKFSGSAHAPVTNMYVSSHGKTHQINIL